MFLRDFCSSAGGYEDFDCPICWSSGYEIEAEEGGSRFLQRPWQPYTGYVKRSIKLDFFNLHEIKDLSNIHKVQVRKSLIVRSKQFLTLSHLTNRKKIARLQFSTAVLLETRVLCDPELCRLVMRRISSLETAADIYHRHCVTFIKTWIFNSTVARIANITNKYWLSQFMEKLLHRNIVLHAWTK